jgi:hypothetical protein
VYLCKVYGLTEENIICHNEGYKLGIASNHADVMHWFPRYGESMISFRAAVKTGLKAEVAKTEDGRKLYRVQIGAYASKDNADAIVKKLKLAGFEGFVKFE